MKGRLWLLNVILLGLVALSASALRQGWLQGRTREEKLLKTMVPVAAAPALTPLPAVIPAIASNYLEVAQKMVFSKDRNAIVIIDPPPPPPPPPPPKPMPSLPLAYGIMNFGEGPTAILREKTGAPSKTYRAGEIIGEFKILAMNNQEILFEWEGKQVKRKLEELVDKTARNVPPPTQAAPASAAAAPATTTLANVKAGPGTDMGGDYRACVPGDSSPAGTVQDGMRKVIARTPFGESCRWEKVK